MSLPLKQSSIGPSLDGFLRTGYLIHDVSRLRRVLYDQRSRHLGITRSQWWVLFNLARGDSHLLTQHELAQRMEMGSAAIGELLVRLEKAGFVRRQPVSGNRRAKQVLIDERGHQVLEHMRQVAKTSHDLIMDGISVEEQRLLDRLLARMKSNLLAQIDSIGGEPENAQT